MDLNINILIIIPVTFLVGFGCGVYLILWASGDFSTQPQQPEAAPQQEPEIGADGVINLINDPVSCLQQTLLDVNALEKYFRIVFERLEIDPTYLSELTIVKENIANYIVLHDGALEPYYDVVDRYSSNLFVVRGEQLLVFLRCHFYLYIWCINSSLHYIFGNVHL